jgi:hypothetical protein
MPLAERLAAKHNILVLDDDGLGPGEAGGKALHLVEDRVEALALGRLRRHFVVGSEEGGTGEGRLLPVYIV